MRDFIQDDETVVSTGHGSPHPLPGRGSLTRGRWPSPLVTRSSKPVDPLDSESPAHESIDRRHSRWTKELDEADPPV
jgi:hypothetical protein